MPGEAGVRLRDGLGARAQLSTLSNECQLAVWELCWRFCVSGEIFSCLLKLYKNDLKGN